jgi:hypothetical protein
MTSRVRLRHRLARLEHATKQAGELIPAPPPPEADAPAVARELAKRFGEMVRHYQRAHGLTPQDAAAQAAEPLPPNMLVQALTGPPDEAGWFELESLARQDPDGFLRRWQEIKHSAREDITSGHYACRVVEGPGSTAWPRAVFLAVRDGLVEAWQPRNPQELQLVDLLAQAQTFLWQYQEILSAHICLAATVQSRALAGKERYELPRLSAAEATEAAMAMIERWHAIYLKTLKGLQGLRRGAPTVVMSRVGQVNLAQHQVNFGSP